jgi:hypothetical protein
VNSFSKRFLKRKKTNSYPGLDVLLMKEVARVQEELDWINELVEFTNRVGETGFKDIKISELAKFEIKLQARWDKYHRGD